MRYIKCFALQVNNEYLPYWLLDYVEDEDYGSGYKYGDGFNEVSYSGLTECLYNLVEKKVVIGIVKDNYEKPEYAINQQVLVQVTYNKYTIKTIKDIVYEEYESKCIKVKDLDEVDLHWYFTKEEISNLKVNDLYEIRVWKPFYVLNDDSVIKYDFKLKELV